MLFSSPLVSDARNKLGGTVASRGRAGLSLRSRVAPTQPRTSAQVAARFNFAAATQGWSAQSPATIEAWRAYAARSTLTNALGQTYTPSGFQMWVRSCRYLACIDGGLPVSIPSIGFPGEDAGPLSATIVTAAGVITTAALTLSRSWAGIYGQVSILASLPLPPGTGYISASRYRQIRPLSGYFSGTLPIYATYSKLATRATPGQLVAFKVTPIATYTGVPSATAYTVTTVTGT